MLIRPARTEDAENIAALYVRNHRTTYKNLLPAEYFEALTEEAAQSKWKSYIDDESNRVWVAEDESGFLGFVASTKDEELENVWYLDSLHVCERARGKGIGTALIKLVGGYAYKDGYEKMSICIVKGNDNAGNLYRKLGARHYKDFEGKMSLSEKLLWDDLKNFA
ncbi:MAG: GNAT family N-acetyltransferase [Clostridia bacterium]|nr:GNAT family N-acetyltransferase [Clostridia bacterium]